MNAQEAVRQQLNFWHGITGQIMSDCGDCLNSAVPNAKIGSISSVFAHAVMSEDGIVHGMFQGKPPIFEAGGWADKTGVPSLGVPPMQTPEWAAKVKMDLPKFQEYAKDVYAATDQYLASLPDSELERKVQGPVGETPLGWFLVNILATHFPGHAGEIAALKGVQGLKGLPF